MGNRGPIPKRSDQRRRRNVAETEITHAEGARVVTVPPADPDWHRVARQWYESLAESGQSRFYEPSDWQTAYLIAESMSRDLMPQVVGTTESGEILRDTIPLKGASLSAYLRAFTVLLVTEGDRRRAQVELERAGAGNPAAEAAAATVTDIRSRLGG